MVKDPRDGVPNLSHHHPRLTNGLTCAFGTRLVGSFPSAGERSEGAVNGSNDSAQSDPARWKGEEVTSAPAFAAVDNSRQLQLQQNRFEELPGDSLSFRKARDQHRSPIVFAGEPIQGSQGVFALLREGVQRPPCGTETLSICGPWDPRDRTRRESRP